MIAPESCAAANDRGPICANGFLQVSLCHGHLCRCGRPEKTPRCLRDEVPEHYVDDAGRMLFRQQEGRQR